MAPIARYLVDNSALNRLERHESVRGRLQPLIDRGLVGVCQIIVLEGCAAATSAKQYRSLQTYYAQFEMIDTRPEALDRALEVQAALAERSLHMNVPLPDLIMAATAERTGVTLIHYDSDFDKIASVSRLTAEWVVERGSVP